MSEIVKRYCVEGRVQGVGFRWFVHREASALGLKGKVRNTDGGAVEVLAAGTEDQHMQLRTRLDKGPRGARVDKVGEQTLAAEEAGMLEAFTIEGAW